MAKRYSVVVSVLDDQEEKEIAQHTVLETNDYEEAAAEFEELADADVDDCLVEDEEDDDSEDDHTGDEASA